MTLAYRHATMHRSPVIPSHSVTLVWELNPVAVPTHSASCPIGQFVAGETDHPHRRPGHRLAGQQLDRHRQQRQHGHYQHPHHARQRTRRQHQLRADCYELTLSHTGQGTDPVAAPTNSAGCAAGFYHYEENIDLTADPDTGWEVTSWTGTDNNGSTADTNTLTMPASAHAASVNYDLL